VASSSPAEELFATVRSLLERMPAPRSDAEVAEELNVSKTQAKEWLSRLVAEGVLEKTSRPVRYRPASERSVQGSLFT
jgi:predicted ArsR family transcriptional regulator